METRGKNRSGEAGFTLIELLIAVVLITFGLMSFITFVGAIMDRNTSNEWKTIAVSLAEERVEELMTKSLETVIDDTDDGATVVSVLNVPFTVTTDVSNGASGILTDISVTVTWVDNLNSSYQIFARVHQP